MIIEQKTAIRAICQLICYSFCVYISFRISEYFSHSQVFIQLLPTTEMAGKDYFSDISICKWSYRGDTTWCVSYPRRVDINLSKVLGCALCLTAAIHGQTAVSVHKNGALTCLRCASQQLCPESPLTDKWQQSVSCCFARATQTAHPQKSHTKSQRNDLTSAVNITLLSPTAVSQFTSAASETVWVTNDSKGLMPLHTCVGLPASPLLHPLTYCHIRNQNKSEMLGQWGEHGSNPARISGWSGLFKNSLVQIIDKLRNDF